MGLPGWSTVAGVAAKIVDRLTDPRKRLNDKLAKLERERDEILKNPSTPERNVKLSSIVSDIVSKRRELERLRD
jgi:hypothetical protein